MLIRQNKTMPKTTTKKKPTNGLIRRDMRTRKEFLISISRFFPRKESEKMIKETDQTVF